MRDVYFYKAVTEGEYWEQSSEEFGDLDNLYADYQAELKNLTSKLDILVKNLKQNSKEFISTFDKLQKLDPDVGAYYRKDFLAAKKIA